MADLSGRVALVVDAGDGLGRGIAAGLAEAGATLYLTARPDAVDAAGSPAALDGAVEEVSDLRGTAFAVAVDSACEQALAALFERIEAEQGRLDVVVGHTGAAAGALRIAAEVMAEQGSGVIVGIAGWEGELESAAADEQRVRDLGRKLAPSGVAALALHAAPVTEVPGPVESTVDMPPAAAPAPTSMRFNGRCVAALAMDPDILEKAGGVFAVTELQREYRFSDPAWVY